MQIMVAIRNTPLKTSKKYLNSAMDSRSLCVLKKYTVLNENENTSENA